jgi:hypothetical protein
MRRSRSLQNPPELNLLQQQQLLLLQLLPLASPSPYPSKRLCRLLRILWFFFSLPFRTKAIVVLSLQRNLTFGR